MSRRSTLWDKKIKQFTQFKRDRLCPSGQIRKSMEIRIQTKQPIAEIYISKMCPKMKESKLARLSKKLSI